MTNEQPLAQLRRLLHSGKWQPGQRVEVTEPARTLLRTERLAVHDERGELVFARPIVLGNRSVAYLADRFRRWVDLGMLDIEATDPRPLDGLVKAPAESVRFAWMSASGGVRPHRYVLADGRIFELRRPRPNETTGKLAAGPGLRALALHDGEVIGAAWRNGGSTHVNTAWPHPAISQALLARAEGSMTRLLAAGLRPAPPRLIADGVRLHGCEVQLPGPQRTLIAALIPPGKRVSRAELTKRLGDGAELARAVHAARMRLWHRAGTALIEEGEGGFLLDPQRLLAFRDELVTCKDGRTEIHPFSYAVFIDGTPQGGATPQEVRELLRLAYAAIERERRS